MTGRRWRPLAVAAVATSAILVTARPHDTDRAVIRDLLEMRAPAPSEEPPTDVPDLGPKPVEDPRRSPEELLGHWGQNRRSKAEQPSDEVRKQLFEAAKRYPDKLIGVLDHLPAGSETHDAVKRIYDGANKAPWFSEYWEEAVRNWLMLNTAYFRDDLVAAALSARDESDGWVVNEDELLALVRLDWVTAEPILEKHSAGGASRVRTLALALMYEHASENKTSDVLRLREELQAIAADDTETGYSRDRAIDSLLETEWVDRDQWYLGLLESESLRDLRDGDYLRSPLAGPAARNPDLWIPRISKLVGHSNRAVHDNAVDILIQFHLRRARADALKPLLPWLFDPEWSSARDRLRLVQSVEGVGLREAIPGLIHVVEHEDSSLRSYAAAELGAFGATEAGPAIRRAVDLEERSSHRNRLVNALLQCGGMPPDELANAIIAFATQISTEEGKEAWEEYAYSFGDTPAVDPMVSIGAAASRETFEPPPGMVSTLFERLPALEAERPAVAATSREILALWSDPEVDRSFVQQLRTGRADAKAIAAALDRREGTRNHVARELAKLASEGGLAAGVATTILGDPTAAALLLSSDDPTARMGLLASARLVGKELPVAEVGELLKDQDLLVSLAAERYLEAHDSAEARVLLLRHHTGQARILGARMSFDPGHATYGVFDELEENLRQEILGQDGPHEIYALLSAGYWGGRGQRFIRVHDGSASFSVCPDPARCHERDLTAEELARLTDFLRDTDFENLGPLDHLVHDGMQYEYVHLTRDGGRRVFMNNPDVDGETPYDRLTDLFFEIERATPLNTRYNLERMLPGVELVLRGSDDPVAAVCGTVDRIFVFTLSENEGEWRLLDGKALRTPEELPRSCLGYGADRLPETPQLEGFESVRNAWQVVSLKDQILSGSWEHDGLWRWDGVRRPIRLVDGWFGGTIVTPDGEWAVSARTKEGENWAKPNPVVRVNSETGKEHMVDIPPADWFAPIAYLQELGSVLLKRRGDADLNSDQEPVGPAEAEFYLLDAATGSFSRAEGDFRPLEQLTYREMQPAGSFGESWVWVAIPDYQSTSTTLAAYDRSTFVVRPIARFPSITFDTADMWVDEEDRRVLVAYEGDLVSLPFATQSGLTEDTTVKGKSR
jgi:HEAT repeat protein